MGSVRRSAMFAKNIQARKETLDAWKEETYAQIVDEHHRRENPRPRLPLVTWREVGETVAGRLIEIRAGRQFDDRVSRIGEIERKDGTRVAFVLTRVLEVRFRAKRIRPGTRVKMVYLGKRRAWGSSHSFKAFEVKVKVRQ